MDIPLKHQQQKLHGPMVGRVGSVPAPPGFELNTHDVPVRDNILGNGSVTVALHIGRPLPARIALVVPHSDPMRPMVVAVAVAMPSLVADIAVQRRHTHLADAERAWKCAPCCAML